MKLKDVAPSPPIGAAGIDPFDLLDMVGDAVVESLRIAAERRVRPSDIPALLHALSSQIESRVGTGGEDIALYYLAARIRECANNTID